MALRRALTAGLVFAELQAGALAQECNDAIQAPIVLPVKNVTVQGSLKRRGMQFTYGTPEQSVAVAVSTGWNETYLYDDEGQCSGITSVACTVGRGGAFDESSSSTWKALSGISALNSEDNVSGNTGSDGLAGTDKLTINSTLAYLDFPVAIPRTSGPDYSTLGLGTTSKLLNYAKSAGHIASESWSLFWGQTGLTNAHTSNGAVVLGGIDETQTTGSNFTGSIKQTGACRSGMIVEVTDMVIELPDGTKGSLLANGVQGQGVNYCLETEFPMITMLLDHWDEWESIDDSAYTSGNSQDRAGGGPNIWGLIYPKANITKADLKITISNSLTITIPNHQLVQAYYTFDSDGSYSVNNTVSELMINPLQAGNANDIPKFGMTFFQAAYLHVNHETNSFTLWEAANPTGKNSSFAGISSRSGTGCGSANNATNTTSPATSPSPGSGSGGDNSGISTGAIAGIAVGAVLGVLALAVGACFLWRRKRRGGNRPPSETATPLNTYAVGGEKPELMGSYGNDRASGYYGGKQELDGRHGGHEMAADTRPAWLPPQEVEGDALGARMTRPLMEPQELPSQRYD